MIAILISYYNRHYSQIYGLTLAVLAMYYLFAMYHGAGGDLMLRVAEAQYFLQRINPYDVYVGRVDRLPAIGDSHAYSFFSYYWASPLSFIPDDLPRKVVFAAVDIFCLATGITITKKIVGSENIRLHPIILAMLMSSVFLWRHLLTLNYNLFAALGAVITFYGLSRRSRFLVLLGMLIVGVKPSFAIPIFICLLVSRAWPFFFISAFAYLTLLMFTAFWLDTHPVDLLRQLKDTQSRFSTGYTDGFFYFLANYLGDRSTGLGICISFLVMWCLRKHLSDPLIGLMLSITLGISLFYNHVHAWIIVYPLIVFALAELVQGKIKAIPFVLLATFVITPRLAGAIDSNTRDTYVAIHNVLRFGLLFVATFLLIRQRIPNIDKRHTTAGICS